MKTGHLKGARAYDAAIRHAMALLWEEKLRYGVLSQGFYALDRAWNLLKEERKHRS